MCLQPFFWGHVLWGKRHVGGAKWVGGDLRMQSMNSALNLSRHCPLLKLQLSGVHHRSICNAGETLTDIHKNRLNSSWFWNLFVEFGVRHIKELVLFFCLASKLWLTFQPSKIRYHGRNQWRHFQNEIMFETENAVETMKTHNWRHTVNQLLIQ